MCEFCKNISETEKPILTHELDVGDGNSCEYGVYIYRENGKVYLSLCDANNGETAYTEINRCPMCGRDFGKD